MAGHDSGRTTAARAADIRGRLAADPALELDAEELEVLADHGIDPEEVRRIALLHDDAEEVSDHDRETVRDDLEALLLTEGEEPGA